MSFSSSISLCITMVVMTWLIIPYKQDIPDTANVQCGCCDSISDPTIIVSSKITRQIFLSFVYESLDRPNIVSFVIFTNKNNVILAIRRVDLLINTSENDGLSSEAFKKEYYSRGASFRQIMNQIDSSFFDLSNKKKNTALNKYIEEHQDDSHLWKPISE